MKIFLSILMLCISFNSFSQNFLKGKVFDANTKEALTGVSILIPGTTNGTTTDFNGNFKLTSVNKIDSVKITFIGYESKNIIVNDSIIKIGLTPSSTALNEVIVSVNRERMNRTDAPVAISSISKTTINDTKATGLEQLLNKTPGVYMVDLGNEQHSMSIRQPLGYKSLFLYLEDGIPIRTTGDFNHNALIEINQAALNHIEVIKGPASSLYGSESVGGAVNFITQAPSYKPTGKIQTEIGSRGFKRSDFFASSTIKKFGIYVGGYYANRNQADSLHNDFNKAALNLRTDYNINDKTRLISTASYVNYKTDQIGGLDSLNFYNKNYVSFHRFTYRSVEAFRAKSNLLHDWNKSNNTSFTLFYRNSTIGQNPFYAIKKTKNPLKSNGEINEDAFQSFGSILQQKKSFNFLQAKWIAGLSTDFSPATYRSKYISIDKNSEGLFYSYTPTDSLLTSYNVDLLNSAAYTQFEVNPLQSLKVTAAIRYDRLDYKFDNHLPSNAFTGAPDETNYFEHFTPKVGATYDFGKDRGVYSNYSVGFAPPNITELYRGVTVPALKPATYNNYEAGGWVSFSKERGFVEVNVYQINGVNEIVSVRLPDGSYQNQNSGKTEHKGIETSIKYSPITELTVRISNTFARHKFVHYRERGIDCSGNMMGQAPNQISNAEAIYKPEFFKGFRMGVEWQSIGNYFMDSKNTQKYEGYNIFNLRFGYTIKGVELWVNTINVTDEVYATTVEKNAFGTSYRPGQLRTFNFGLGYNFGRL